jgi:hypothetical protein
MRIDAQDFMLDALIALFNSQAAKQDWDAAYGTSLALAEHYEQRAQHVRECVALVLKNGVVARAREAAETITKKKKH